MLTVRIEMTNGDILEYEFEDTVAEPALVAEIEKGMIEGCRKTNIPWVGGYSDQYGVVHPDQA